MFIVLQQLVFRSGKVRPLERLRVSSVTALRHYGVTFDVHAHRKRLHAHREKHGQALVDDPACGDVTFSSLFLRNRLSTIAWVLDEAIALERLHRTRVRGRRKPTHRVDIGSREARHHRRFNTSVCKWLADKVARFSRF